MLFKRAFLSAAAALLVLLAAPAAMAQRVVLVRPPPPDDVLSEAFDRLRAELALEGFETWLVDLDPIADTPDALAALAAKDGALAGISLTRRVGAPSADVCIADRVTGKISMRTIELRQATEAPSVLAVRAADLLRLSLREFAGDQKPPSDVVGVETQPVPEVVKRFANVPPGRFRVDVRAAALGITQKIGPGYAPALAVSYRHWDRFGAGLLVAGPALGASYGTSTGSASITQELVVARAWGAFLQASLLELRGVLYTGIYHLDASGHVTPPLVARSAQVTSFAGGAGVEADVRLNRRLVVGAELSAFELAPRAAVAVSDEQYTFPWPFVTATMGFGMEF